MPLRTLIVTGTAPARAHRGARRCRASRRGLTRDRAAAAVARDLRHRTAEVDVEVVDALVDQRARHLAHVGRIAAVELHGARRLVGLGCSRAGACVALPLERARAP